MTHIEAHRPASLQVGLLARYAYTFVRDHIACVTALAHLLHRRHAQTPDDKARD